MSMRCAMNARVGRRALLVFLAMVGAARAQQGAMVFDAPHVVGDETANFTAIGDLDGDGDLDLVSSGVALNAIQFGGYFNQGAAGWTKGGVFPIAETPTVAGFPATLIVRAADVNGDGKKDIVYANNAAVAALVFGASGQAPSIGWFFFEPTVVQGLETADFDGDGLEDVAVLTPQSLKTYRCAVAAPPTLWSTWPTANGLTRWQLRKADVDGQAPVDLAAYGTIPGSTSSSLRLHTVTSTGSLGPPLALTVNGPIDGTLAVADLDADGDEDFAVSHAGDMLIVRRNGPATFTFDVQPEATYAELFVDVDGDGDLDGVRGAPTTTATTLDVGENYGGALGGNVTWYSAPGTGVVVSFADLDGDGDLDWTLSRAVGYGGVTAKSSRHGASVGDRRIVDYDGDGDIDLNFQLNGSSFLTSALAVNDGSGAFTTGVVGIVGGASFPNTGGLPVDFDGDGLPDLLNGRNVLRNFGGDILVNVGPGTTLPSFMDPFDATPQSADNCFSADLDADGDEDVIVRTRPDTFASSLGMRFWWNVGGGQFIPGDIHTSRRPLGIVDLDGDGLQDVVVYRHLSGSLATGSGEIRVWRNTGSGVFLTDGDPGAWPPLENAGLHNIPPAFGDLDDDGDLDAAIFGVGSARTALNDGAGNFSTLATYPLFAPTSIGFAFGGGGALITDVDGDGMTDVVMNGGVKYSACIGTFLRTGPATFAPPIIQFVEPKGLADVDGDGDPDAVGAAYLWKNLKRSGPSAGLRRQYGTATSVTALAGPRLGARGPIRAGEVMRVLLGGGLSGTDGYLIVGGGPLGIFYFGHPLLVFPEILWPIALTGPSGVWPEGSYSIDFAIPPWFGGVPLYLQTWTIDSGAPMGIATSNGLELIFGW